MTTVSSSGGTEDVALELLHSELVSQVCAKPAGSPERAKAISDLELLGKWKQMLKGSNF